MLTISRAFRSKAFFPLLWVALMILPGALLASGDEFDDLAVAAPAARTSEPAPTSAVTLSPPAPAPSPLALQPRRDRPVGNPFIRSGRFLRDRWQQLVATLRSWLAALHGLPLPGRKPDLAPQPESLVQHANGLYQQYAGAIARELGVDSTPQVTVEVTRDPNAPIAYTMGTQVVLQERYFAGKPEDGAIIHEFAHAIHRSRQYDSESAWLVEGIADYVRDRLGFQAPHSAPHFEVGGARRGYQTTAHFLFWLEERRLGGVRELSRALTQGSYTADTFRSIYGSALDDLIGEYEAAHTTQG